MPGVGRQPEREYYHMANFEIYIATIASIIIAIATMINTYMAIHNRNKIQESIVKVQSLAISIDGRMEALLRATGAEGKAEGVAQERQESRDRGGAP